MPLAGDERGGQAKRRTAIRAFIASSGWVKECSPEQCPVQPPATFEEIDGIRREMRLNVSVRVIGHVVSGNVAETLSDRSCLTDLEHQPPDSVVERAIVCVQALARRVTSSRRRVMPGETLIGTAGIEINLTTEYGEAGARRLIQRYIAVVEKQATKPEPQTEREAGNPAEGQGGEGDHEGTIPNVPLSMAIVEMIREHRREEEEEENRRREKRSAKPNSIWGCLLTVFLFLVVCFAGVALIILFVSNAERN